MRLSEKEWTVLEALWDNGGAELGDLVDALRPATGWSRNTVFTYLTRMEGKGLVSIDKESCPHTYHATLDRAACQAEERQSFLKRVYRGSAGDMVAAFLKEEQLSPQEREKLRRMLDGMEV